MEKLQPPKVTVIIPVYNTEKYLRECLNSVVKQSLRDIEIICVDDGSTDGSPSIIHEYAEADSRIKLLSQENKGSGPARNLGIKTALGEYISFMDADDYFPDDRILKKLYCKAKKHHAAIVGGSFSTVQPSGKVVTRFHTKRLLGYTFNREGMLKYTEYQFDYGYQRFLFAKSLLVYNDIYFPPYLRFQDPPFFVQAMIAADHFYAIRDVSYCYRIGTGSRKINENLNKTLGLILGYADNLETAKKNGLLKLYQLTFERCYIDDWHIVLAAELFHDTQTDAALKRLDQAIDLSLLKNVNRFSKWRYKKDREIRRSGRNVRHFSIWSNRTIVHALQMFWRGWRCLRENDIAYFWHRLRNQ